MSDLKKLAKRLMTLDDRIIACMKCGMCQAVCPMFGATMMEADVARGKLALVDNLAHEMIADPEAVADKLGRCLLCGSCEANCPSGVKIMDIFMEAREIVNTYLGLHPVKKMVFRALLPYPGLFNFAMRVGAPMQRVIFRSNKDTQNTACAPMLNFMLGDRHIRSLALKPLHAIYGNLDEPRVMGGLKVAFFPGCMGDKLYVDVSEACIKVLHHHNVAIYMPSSFACCGIPALSSGDAEGMVKQMAKSLAAFGESSFDYVLTNPPFGKKSSLTFTNEKGEQEEEELVYNRQDFWTTSSNKQLNFVQHINTILKVTGKAAVVVPDNVLFEGGAGETVRKKLLETTDLHTILRLPTGIFYKPGVKANVIFFDKRPASADMQTKEVWIYDFRTNVHFTLKQHPMTEADLADFVKCYHPENRHERTQTWSEDNPDGRFRRFDIKEILERDKTSLDLFWIKDKSLADLDSLPEPDALASDIIENLQNALESFQELQAQLGK